MILKTIDTDLKEALKKREGAVISTLRMIIAALHNEAIALKKKDSGLNDQEEIAVLKREVKKRRDSVAAYEQGGRPELAQKEKEEIAIIEKYLPPSLSDEEIKKIVDEVIAEMGEVNASQFGTIMKKVMEKLAGQADGAKISQLVKEHFD